MFNLTGSEIMFLLIIGLVVLGPEKLPDAIRRVGRLYAELKRMSSGVQTDLRKVMDEPLKEMMNTTNSMKALFNDTSDQFQSAAREIATPSFVPYSPSDSKSPDLPVVLYDGDDVETESLANADDQKSENLSADLSSTVVEESAAKSSLDDVS
ncbi:Sec-independent protein translocase protein TatB [Actinomycetes bacterium]|nr:Sec-independent protein translocase protein TatB [Actinomycetes bacterium]